jgi:hypothetical protein
MALTNQLLNHFKEKFGIVTVVNAVFYDVDGEQPKIAFDSLKMSNITSEGQQKEIRGGQGAELLLQYDFGRTASIEITDALVSIGSLEYLFGGAQSNQSTMVYQRRAERDVTALIDVSVEDNLVTLNYLPADVKSGTNLYALYVKPNGEKGKFEGNTTTIDAPEDLPVGTKISIFYTGEQVIGTNKVTTGTFTSTPALPAEPNDYIDGTDVIVIVRDLGATSNDLIFTKVGDWPTAGDFSGEAEGDAFEVYYQSNSATANGITRREMILRASDFPPVVKMVGETVVLDADTGRKIALQVEIPKLKLNANFTFSFDAEGDPSVFDFSGVALSHRGELLKIRTLGEI